MKVLLPVSSVAGFTAIARGETLKINQRHFVKNEFRLLILNLQLVA